MLLFFSFFLVDVLGYFSRPFSSSLLVQSPIELLEFLSVSVLFQTILSNARLDRSKLDKKGHKFVKLPTAIAGRHQLDSAQFRVHVAYFAIPYFSSFDLSKFSLDNRFIPNNSVQCLIGQVRTGQKGI